jgi:tetratricopeptide (TPR) repeat protein
MPESLDELIFKGEQLLFEKKFEIAIKIFKKILKSHPKEGTVRKSIGIAYFELGKYEYALENFKLATDIDPLESEIWGYLGKIYLIKAEKEKALWCFNKVIEIDRKTYGEEFQDLIGYGIEEEKKKLEEEGVIPVDPELEPKYIICRECGERILIDINTKFCRNCGGEI